MLTSMSEDENGGSGRGVLTGEVMGSVKQVLKSLSWVPRVGRGKGGTHKIGWLETSCGSR